jgi:hypothetical protein
VVKNTIFIEGNILRSMLELWQIINTCCHFKYKPLASKLNFKYYIFISTNFKVGFEDNTGIHTHQIHQKLEVSLIVDQKLRFQEYVNTWMTTNIFKCQSLLSCKTKKTHEVSNPTFKLKSQMFASSKKQSFQQWTSNCKCCFKICFGSPCLTIVWR